MAVPYRNESEEPAADVWSVPPGQPQRARPVHIVITAVLFTAGILAGAFGSINFPLGFGVNFFWTGITVQQVGAIWFGAWGVLAGTIFPIFSNMISGQPFDLATAVTGAPLFVSLAYIPANFLQAFLPAWAFRHYRADPRLRSGRDYIILLAAMVVSSAFGALWSPLVLRMFGMLGSESLLLYMWGWFGGNVVAGLVFNFILMQAFSSLVVRSTVFVRRWWA